MKKNFYKVLGIPNGADLNSIKKAYRKAAKKFHPDISPKNEERFKEIQEAYETLSNPQKRAIYDQEEFRKPEIGVEQFTPRSFTSMASPFHLFEQMEEIFSYLDHSWIDEIHDFFHEGEEDQHVFSVEITLSPEQARRGCEIPLKIPIWINCKRCHGTGYTKGLICGFCRGRGQEKLEKQIKISIPSGVKDGMRITIPIDDKNFDLSYIEANLKINR